MHNYELVPFMNLCNVLLLDVLLAQPNSGVSCETDKLQQTVVS